MRLLKTNGYQLTEANDIPVPFPQYAILSHTWISPKDEITYQDLKQRKGDIENDIFKQKGWAKLQRYCHRAARDGWEWAWMDTCCIDKTNPADTQEAINAMFRWYQNAGICYAYLDDVDVGRVVSDPDLADIDLDDIAGKNNVTDPTSFPHEALKPFMTKAKWFSRGWTLQELLAPPYLVFVDQAWRRIGTRESWAEQIRKASRIEARHLTHFDPTDFTACSIAMRFSWASLRETTVEEDETYSLLGLFGVSLPLIYGEGRWRAFNRLQRELITVYSDDSIFAWKIRQPLSGRITESHEKADKPGRGILAPSIREYWDASKIEAFGFYDNSFAMTNKGLEINAKRWRRKDDLSMCLIRLNCGFGASSRLAIHLTHVNDTYDRIQLHQICDMETIAPDEWEEESTGEPTVIRASNYSNVSISSSILILEYPNRIKIGNKYFVDFDTSIINTKLKLWDESFSQQGFTEDEFVMKPNRLAFINITLQDEASRSKFDIIVNLSGKSFPSVGILSRTQEPWERLGDPLTQASTTYEQLADHLHYKVATDPVYPVNATDEREDAMIGVCLLPRPRKKRPSQRNADKINSATSREYLLKITLQEDGQSDGHMPERSAKRRRTGA
ncbi:hypothetical protein PFICI_11265 [Pestalotiopsis fici W106-1]|uniref:Heterokaryon incompatibility domain-containing protein n=1 Tax=Pestalotiopsis fici (strain W106-1 / CGMCC3.15140) TaxID=1229662 RepID=W3WWZ5_PESFW|nr:uncharacterized protein PFICI_11265 [Pestalotiopsis fici W106-1]ETS77391.1 hypothetical protein PFICI_11265 [Pestalotiopsis fici W106-1]